MRRLVVEGAAIAYEESGSGDGLPLLFLHGWTSDRSTWRHQIPAFSHRHRCIAIDLPGHGGSDPVPGARYDIAFHAGRLAAFIAQLGLEDAVPVGHSLGGILALALAARPGARHPAAVLVDPAPLLRTGPMQRSLERTAQMMRDLGRGRTQEILGDKLFFRPTDPPELPAEIQRIAAATDEEAALRTWDGIVAHDATADLRAAAVPLLFVNSDRPQNREDDIRALAARLHWGRTIGTGHFNHLVMPRQVNAMIADFLERLVPASQSGISPAPLPAAGATG